MNGTIGPEWLAALKQSSRVVKTTDRQAADGVYAVFTKTALGGVEMRGWASGTRWRVWGAPASTVSTLNSALGGVLVARFEHRRFVGDDGVRLDSDLDGLKGALTGGHSVSVPVRGVESFTPPWVAHGWLTRGVCGDPVALPGARDASWKDDDGKPLPFPLPNGRVLAAEFLAPFKGRELRRVSGGDAWMFVSDDGFGLIAERAAERVNEDPPRPEPRGAWG